MLKRAPRVLTKKNHREKRLKANKNDAMRAEIARSTQFFYGLLAFGGTRQPQKYVANDANVTGVIRCDIGNAAVLKGTMGRVGHCAADFVLGGKAIQPDGTFNGRKLHMFSCHVSDALFIDK